MLCKYITQLMYINSIHQTITITKLDINCIFVETFMQLLKLMSNQVIFVISFQSCISLHRYRIVAIIIKTNVVPAQVGVGAA